MGGLAGLLLALVTVLAASALFLGRDAGPMDRGDYSRGLVDALAQVRAPGGSVDGAGLQSFGDSYVAAADELDELSPPPDAAGPHSRLTAGLRRQGEVLHGLGDASGDPAGYVQKLAESQSTDVGWVDALHELERLGYTTAPAS